MWLCVENLPGNFASLSTSMMRSWLASDKFEMLKGQNCADEVSRYIANLEAKREEVKDNDEEELARRR